MHSKVRFQMEHAYRLLEPVSLAGLRMENRIVLAPMSRVSATLQGVPTERMARYYTGFAEGGFGLVISEGIFPDCENAQAYRRQPGLKTLQQVNAWRSVTEAVHEARGKIVAQLMHAGALSQCLDETFAPSAVRPRGEKMPAYGGHGPFPTPRAMTRADIDRAIDGFARSARLAQEAGFDGVEIHGANGYLIDQFLTDYTNLRNDEFGADVAGRVRFAAEVLTRVRAAVDPQLPVGIRLSQTKVNDDNYRWPGGQRDAEVIFAAVRDAGASFVHLASEGRDWRETALLEPNGLTVTALARSITGVPVIANGGMHNADLAERVLRQGQADLVSLARGALANPDWPRRLAEGRPFAVFDHNLIYPNASLEHADAWSSAKTGGACTCQIGESVA